MKSDAMCVSLQQMALLNSAQATIHVVTSLKVVSLAFACGAASGLYAQSYPRRQQELATGRITTSK
eukprot:1148921-Pelagomonas_calceolata.AAC.6